MQIIQNKDLWNKVVKSFKNWDIYYLYDYVVPLAEHGDGTPKLLYFECKNCRLCYVLMVNDIANSEIFKNNIQRNLYFDAITPYGYGGPIVDGIFDENASIMFRNELHDYCIKSNIVTQFIRFNPILNNYMYFNEICEVTTYKKTVYIDTMNKDNILKNMDSKNRNMIRKAKKNNIKIIYDYGENINKFIPIYNQTMKSINAEKYYYFKNDYYLYLKNHFKDNLIIFYAMFNNEIISASIFLYNNNYMHYHLSGTLSEYRSYASVNLLIYEAALWASEKNISKLHLGGGILNNDSLFNFKKKFNKSGILPFYIGRTIFDLNKYNMLIEIRSKVDINFDPNNSYLIKYRR